MNILMNSMFITFIDKGHFGILSNIYVEADGQLKKILISNFTREWCAKA